MASFNSLPPELVRKIFKELMAYSPLWYKRNVNKIYTNESGPDEGNLEEILKHPWDGGRPYHDSLEHPKLKLPPYEEIHGLEEIRESLCSWMATCRIWHAIAKPFSDSTLVVCVDDSEMGIVPAGTCTLQLYAADVHDDDEEAPPALDGLDRFLPVANGASLTALCLDTYTLHYFEAIVARLPGSFAQIQALRIEFGDVGDYAEDAPESFYRTLSRCTSLRQLLVACDAVVAELLVQAIQQLPEIIELTIRSTFGGSPPHLQPSTLAGNALRHLVLEGIVGVALASLLAVAQSSVATLEFLSLCQLRPVPLPVAPPSRFIHPHFPRLEYLSIYGGHSRALPLPPWTSIPELVNLLDNSPRLRHLRLSSLNWDEPVLEEVPDSSTPGPPRLSPTKRFLDKITNGVVRKAYVYGDVPQELEEVIRNPPKEWEDGVLEMLAYQKSGR